MQCQEGEHGKHERLDELQRNGAWIAQETKQRTAKRDIKLRRERRFDASLRRRTETHPGRTPRLLLGNGIVLLVVRSRRLRLPGRAHGLQTFEQIDDAAYAESFEQRRRFVEVGEGPRAILATFP